LFLRLGKLGLFWLYSTPTVREVLAAVRGGRLDDAPARLDLPVALIWGEATPVRESRERMLCALPARPDCDPRVATPPSGSGRATSSPRCALPVSSFALIAGRVQTL
jgi:hypothetical protein